MKTHPWPPPPSPRNMTPEARISAAEAVVREQRVSLANIGVSEPWQADTLRRALWRLQAAVMGESRGRES